MLKRLFDFDPRTMTVRREVVAGLTTFLTMAYILAVNPNVLSSTGMDRDALFTTTVIASVFATLVMAFYAKLPFALAPGMGLNAFFAYTVCLTMGYSWQFALTAVLIEGILFILLTATGIRERIVNALPEVIRKAIAPGIGLFIAFIGLQQSGIIVRSEATLVTLGDVTSPQVVLTLVGLLLTSVLLVRKVAGALLIGILVTTLLGIPFGVTHWQGLCSLPPSPAPIVLQFDFEHIWSLDMLVVVFTFLFIDLFDTIGTLVGMSVKAGMVDRQGKIRRLNRAFMADALGTTFGALMGTSTVTTVVENAAGVNEGGRSGLTAFVTAMGLVLALFFAPFFLSVPTAATAPILILVGLMMLSTLKEIDFSEYSRSISAFLCLIMMPLAYSISEGISIGMISYVLVNLLSGHRKRLTVTMYILTVFFLLKYLIG